jgi:hypothetical protein
MDGDGQGFSTAPLLTAVPWLIHGFGRAGFGEEDLRASTALRGFRPVVMRQLHSDIIRRLEGPPAAKLEGDALMTDVRGLLLVIRTADCLPVLLADAGHRAVAAVHCGWRGTEKRILEKTVRAMAGAYGTRPEDLVAALGPSIGAACYEVGPEVREAFSRAGFPAAIFTPAAVREADRQGHGPTVHVPASSDAATPPRGAARSCLDLRAANTWLLEALGVKRAGIWSSEACTHCDPGLLSYRRHRGEPRRMLNFIGIRE